MRLITAHDPGLSVSNISLAWSRIICSTTISILCAYLINDSSNIFGASGHMSDTATILSFYWLSSAILCMIGLVLKQFWSVPLTCVSSTVSAIVFALVIAEQPLIAGPVFLYQSYIAIAGSLYERITASSVGWKAQLSSFRYEDNPYETWLIKFRKSSFHFIFFNNILFLLVIGFKITQLNYVLNTVYVFSFISMIICFRYLYLRYRYALSKQSTIIMLLILVSSGALVNLWFGALSIVLLFLFFLAINLCLILQSPFLKDNTESFQSAPGLFVILSFAGLVGLGALFLSLPQASSTGVSKNFMDALFTAVSAACVTGLSIVDINKEFSSFGIFLIMILIQMGGLGIMVLSIFATVALGGRLGVRTEKAFSDFFMVKGIKSTNQLIIFMVISTLLIEIIGAGFLFYDFYFNHDFNLAQAVKTSIFHAISAFCNAGFALTSNSLSTVASSPFVLIVYGVLIVLGGLGFVVLLEILARITKKNHHRSLSVQTKIVLTMSLILVFGGACFFMLIEWNNAFANLSLTDKIFNSIFHTISLRTAGFHTINVEYFSYGSWVIMLVFMFIGGAPGGTAGGIKLTTFATILATLPALVQNNNRVTIFKKECSMQTVAKSSALIILSLTSIGILWFLLLITQDINPMDLLFEVFSATGTVGLSSAATEKLNIWGQIIILSGMFIGRIGPLTLAIALAQEHKSKIIYPTAQIMIG